MAKPRKPSTTRKPPVPSDSHVDIEDWIRRVMLKSTTFRTAWTPAAGNSTINARLAPAPKLIASLPVLLDRDLAARVPLAQDLLGRVLAPAIVATTEQEPRPDEQGDPEQRKQQEPGPPCHPVASHVSISRTPPRVSVASMLGVDGSVAIGPWEGFRSTPWGGRSVRADIR
jgi:hypothetical protein